MPISSEIIVIECTEEIAVDLRSEIDHFPDSQSQVSQRRNLDGSVATWIVFATLAAQALPHLLTFINARLGEPHRVRKIKVGDIEIENPTEEDLKRLRALFPTHARGEESSDE